MLKSKVITQEFDHYTGVVFTVVVYQGSEEVYSRHFDCETDARDYAMQWTD